MKVFQIGQSIAHFDQWKPLILKMPFEKNTLGGLRGCRGLEVVFEVTEAKISKSSSFYDCFFVIYVLDKISKGMIVTIEKEPSEYFQQLHF